jgi:hypothetical protein
MHASVRLLNKKQIPICKQCTIKAIQKSKEEIVDVDDSCSDICSTIIRTQTLEDETIHRLHKLNSIIEESNNLVA